MDNVIYIRGGEIEKRDQFYASMKAQLPEGFLEGKNLDALHDALTSLTTPTTLRIEDEKLLEDKLGHYWQRINRVLEASAAENDCILLERNLVL